MALSKEAREYFAKEGRKGGKTRAANLTKARRQEISKAGAAARWAKQKKEKSA